MASISTAPGGIRRILYRDPVDNKRQTIYLGKVSMKLATTWKVNVENLVAARASHTFADPLTLEWVNGLADDMHKKLAGVGLIAGRGAGLLEAFLTEYIESRSDVKERTTINLNAAKRRLVEFFKADKNLREITEGDADRFLVWMKAKYANATIGRTIKRCRQFWKAAIRRRLATSNPFATVKAPSEKNRTRAFFVTREMAEKVLDACPDAQWRLLFALCRFGGLRCPSEPLALEWDDVDWANGRIRIHSSKLEAHESGGERLIPLFPELRQLLTEAAELAPEGAVNVITKYRGTNANLRTQLARIIRRAGLTPWPRLFQNLRATRETELAAEHPLHVVVSWMGNSAAVAAAHYLQVRDSDFTAASRPSNAPATQNPTQPTSADACRREPANEKAPAFVEPGLTLAGVGSSRQNYLVPRVGLEPTTR